MKQISALNLLDDGAACWNQSYFSGGGLPRYIADSSGITVRRMVI